MLGEISQGKINTFLMISCIVYKNSGNANKYGFKK
jgi:hypothetical protein